MMAAVSPLHLQGAILDRVDALIVILDCQGHIVHLNRACEQMTGYSLAEIEGKAVRDFLIIPEEIETIKNIFAKLKNQDDEFPNHLEMTWVSKAGGHHLIAWSNTMQLDLENNLEYLICTGIDITEQRQNEVALRQQVRYEQLLGGIAAHIRESIDLSDILRTTVTEVRQVLDTDRVLIFRFEPDWSGQVIVESLGSGPWLSSFEMHIHDSCFSKSHVKRYQEGRICAVEDILQANLSPCYVEFLEQFQVRANLIVPILQGDQLWGLLIAHHCSAPRTWLQQDITLLSRLATQVAIAIQQSELYQQLQAELVEREQVEVVLQEARKNLEQKVTERTIELINVNQQLNLELREHRATEKALQVSQDRFAGILDIADDAIISIDAKQKITLFNQGAERIFGYAAVDILGQSLDLLLPSLFYLNPPQQILSSAQSLLPAKNNSERTEAYGRRQDGSEFPVEASISKLELESETISTIILRDISQQKFAQEALEQLSHQNELILNAIGEGLCGLNPEGQFTFVNAAAERYLGHAAADLIDQPIERLLPGGYEQEVLAPVYTTLHTGIIHSAQKATFCPKNRSCFPVEYLTTPILERGEIVGAVITFEDISDRNVMERMKDEFISVVSHELRTPLTSIHGSLQMMASGMLKTQPEKSQRLLKIATESADHLVQLINDILDVERIESGSVQIVPQICGAGPLMTQAANSMQSMADKMGVTLSVTPLNRDLWADPTRILQTLTNLLSNAIKFSEVGHTVWLEAERIKAQREGAQSLVCFSVKDLGRGIPKDKLSLIFERFQQADSSVTRNHDGTGLGLAICRSIVQRHGGQIWVESQFGQGSTFYFTIPEPSSASVSE